jgi:CHAD domain-containing protein
VTFRLQSGAPIAAEIARAARKQLKQAGRDLADLPGHSAVHEIRKRFKRVRALARLARSSLGERCFGVSNQALRDAGKPLAELRDAEAMLGAFDKLKRGGHIAAAELGPLRDGLKNHYDAVCQKLSSPEHSENTSGLLQKARKAVRDWKIDARGWSAIQSGLTKSYTKARKAFAIATIDPSILNLHEWRKQVKYLWNEIEFIKTLRPRRLGRLAVSLRRLGELLGDDHDLAVLAQTVEAKQDDWNAVAVVRRLLPLAHQRRERMQRKAIRLGEQIFRLPPRRFVPDLKRRSRG